jgi:hypothetical protein
VFTASEKTPYFIVDPLRPVPFAAKYPPYCESLPSASYDWLSPQIAAFTAPIVPVTVDLIPIFSASAS